jgi:hypothetical protein
VDPAALSDWSDQIKELTQLTAGMDAALTAVHQRILDLALGDDPASRTIADDVGKAVGTIRETITGLHTALGTGSDGVQSAAQSYAKTDRAAIDAAESVKGVTDG